MPIGAWIFFHGPIAWGQTKREMLTLKVMANKNPFNLTRSEFANKLGISTDNLKKKMKRGHYQSSYIKRDGKYYFGVQEAVRPNQDLSLGTNVPRKRKRGNHFKGKYPNLSLIHI